MSRPATPSTLAVLLESFGRLLGCIVTLLVWGTVLAVLGAMFVRAVDAQEWGRHRVMVDGQVREVTGWRMPNGMVRFSEEHQTNPRPDPAVKLDPIPAVSSEPEAENFGLDAARMDHGREGGERYLVSGPVSRAFARAAREGKLADDSHLPRATLIAPDTVRADAKRRYSELADSALWQGYPHGHWAVKLGHDQGQDVLLIQRPSGEVVGRLPIDSPIDVVRGAIRKADPNYDPSKDPDGSIANPLSDVFDLVRRVPSGLWPWLVAGVAVILLLRTRPPNPPAVPVTVEVPSAPKAPRSRRRAARRA